MVARLLSWSNHQICTGGRLWIWGREAGWRITTLLEVWLGWWWMSPCSFAIIHHICISWRECWMSSTSCIPIAWCTKGRLQMRRCGLLLKGPTRPIIPIRHCFRTASNWLRYSRKWHLHWQTIGHCIRSRIWLTGQIRGINSR